MAAMAVTAAFPVKVSAPSLSLRRPNFLTPRISLRMLGLSNRVSLCVRAEVREPAAFTEPEILPSEPNTNTSSQFVEQGEVTEAEFTEVSQYDAPPEAPQQQEYSAPQQQQPGYDGSEQQEPGEYDAQYEMDGGQYGEEESYDYDESQYYDQTQYTPGQYDESQYNHNQFEYANSAAAANVEEAPQAPAEPPPHYDNEGKVMKFIAVGRAMQLKMDSQKDFERFLDHCNAYGVMVPEKPGDIKRNLCELDPKETWIVVDSRAVLKFAKKLALEEAERNKDYPPGFVENMLNRDKYGRYKSDDD